MEMGDFIRDKISNGEYNTKLPYPHHKLRKEDPSLYQRMMEAYNKDDRRLHTQFIDDLQKEFDTENSPIKNELYSYAYEEGHAYGYSEIYNKYMDLVEAFAKPVDKEISKYKNMINKLISSLKRVTESLSDAADDFLDDDNPEHMNDILPDWDDRIQQAYETIEEVRKFLTT